MSMSFSPVKAKSDAAVSELVLCLGNRGIFEDDETREAVAHAIRNMIRAEIMTCGITGELNLKFMNTSNAR